MLICHYKGHPIQGLSGFFVALYLLSTACYGEDNGAPPPLTTIQADANPPPVGQVLVPESVLALRLAVALRPGSVTDEAKAEKLLSGLGIEPKSGWISEYPVTPSVLGDVEKGILAACDQGKIPLTKDQALKVFGEVKARLGLDVQPGANAPSGLVKPPSANKIYSYTDAKGMIYYTDEYDSIPQEYRDKAKIISSSPQNSSGATGSSLEPQYRVNQNPDDINSYYDDQGPPIVTYYAPPDPYYYLYSWVPYPFWSTGFYFPGYFVLNNFSRHIDFNQHDYFVAHHVGGGAFSGPMTIDSVNPTLPGHLAPSSRFATANAQVGARAIATLNQNRAINGAGVSQTNTARPPFLSAVNSRPMNNAPAVANVRATQPSAPFRPAPAVVETQYTAPTSSQRYMPAPSFVQEPAYRSPGPVGGEFHGGAARGGHR